MEPIIASDNAETALVPHGEKVDDEEELSEEYSSEEEEEEDFPPGPVDPEKCTVGGPGTTGGAAQAPVSFYIHAKDSRDKKLEAGGDYVVVKVLPGNTAKATGARESEAIVKDNGDGSYTATYSVDARGDYELTVEINGSAVGGSPFPVFFSPPEERPSGDSVLRDASGAAVDASTVSSAAATAPLPVISIMGADAYAAKVEFPKGEALDRTVIVGSMNPQVTLEQLRQLFSYSGNVTHCEFTGEGDKFALAEFSNPKEAEQALTLDKLLVIDRQIRVEPAHTAFESKGQSGGTQLAALQLQQIQQLQKAQMEQHSLAAQVAHMRVQAKQNPAAFNPGLPQNSASQKAAALSAIAALSKRLTGSSHGALPAAPPPSGVSKRRRPVSPTLRYRSEKRARSRSPLRQRSPPRRRSPESSRDRRRESSRDRRQESSRDRRRESSRDRRRESSRDRRRESSRDWRRESSRDRRRRSHSHSRRDQRERSSRREGSWERTSQRGASRDLSGRDGKRQSRQERRKVEDSPRSAEQGDAGKERGDRENGRKDRRRREESDPQGPANGSARQPGGLENGRSAEDSKAVEAQQLREKALEVLKTMNSKEGGAEAEGEAGEPSEEGGKERRHKEHKPRKEKKHKKEKRHKRDKDED